ncbi:hypothetical protein CEQ90_05755 [Lewinellaceae bacterium SD302]|nr:hypothetical protein CEQ90_05755 [Lewinellaceae bacterium SD302]
MKHFLLIILLVLTVNLSAQDLYDLTTIQTIEISFAESNWDALLDAAYSQTGDYILAQSVTINGVVFDSVGVKYKGNSTYQSNQTKNPFHIELDTYRDQEYEGYTDIKLSNVAKDPSFLREVLSYQILRQYMDAPLSNYANVYVNGTLIGLYSNSESISRKFVDKRFGSKNNTFVKCNPPDGAGQQTQDIPNLVYLGNDSTDYFEGYELKSTNGWQELIDLCDTLANHTDAIEDILDVDRTLWMLAFNNALVNLDSYSGSFAQNYYLYRSDDGRFLPVVWDLNESFGRFAMTGSSNLNNTAAKQTMDHLLHENNTARPLIQRLMAVPTYKKMYLAHLKTMVEENFANGQYEETGMELQTVIAAAVQADINKFFSYNNFLNNLTSDVNSGGGPGGGNTPGITNLMDARASYLLNTSDLSQAEPTIEVVSVSDESPQIGEVVTITVEVATANTVYFGYRNNLHDKFIRLEMFDDGAHNDGAANDGIYGASLEITDNTTQYYVYAENDDIGKFSPVRAEHEYYVIEVEFGGNTAGDLVINELLAGNDTTQADQDGKFDDWIELYNNTDEAIDLSGYFLTDDPEEPLQWEFPAGTMIEAADYLIIWADDDEDQAGLHANFKLSGDGETIILSAPNGDVEDQVTYGEQTDDISFGRFPNGTGDFEIMVPTFNGENSGPISSTNQVNLAELNLTVFPNPTSNNLFIRFEDQSLSGSELLVRMIAADGREVLRTLAQNATNSLELNVSELPTGMYFLAISSEHQRYGSRVLVTR